MVDPGKPTATNRTGYSIQQEKKQIEKKQISTVGEARTALFVQNWALYRWAKRKKVIICRLQKANLKKSSLAEFGGDVRSFAGDRDGCCVGGTWHDRVVSGGRLTLGSSRCSKVILK